MEKVVVVCVGGVGGVYGRTRRLWRRRGLGWDGQREEDGEAFALPDVTTSALIPALTLAAEPRCSGTSMPSLRGWELWADSDVSVEV